MKLPLLIPLACIDLLNNRYATSTLQPQLEPTYYSSFLHHDNYQFLRTIVSQPIAGSMTTTMSLTTPSPSACP